MKKERRKLKKVLLGFITTVAATALCISVLLYHYFVSYYVDTARGNLSQQLNNAQQITDDLLGGVNKKLFFLAENTNVLRLLNSDGLSQLELYYCLYDLRSFQQENDGLYRSIYYYNASNQRVYIGMHSYPVEEFFDREIIERIKNGDCRNLSPIPRTAHNGLTETSTEDYYTFVYCNTNRDSVKSAIIINMSAEYVRSVAMSVYEDNIELLIVDADGRVVLGNEAYPFCTSLESGDPLNNYLNGNDSGDGFLSLNSGHSMVSYVQSTVCGWKYTGIIAYSTIQKEIIGVISQAVLLLFVFAAFAILIGVYVVEMIYRSHLLRVREVQEKYEQQQRTGDAKLQKALYNAIVSSGERDWEHVLSFGVCPDFSSAFRIVVFASGGAKKRVQNASSHDRELFFYGIRNILQELFTQNETAAFVCEHNEDIIVLLNGREELLLEEWIREQAQLAQEKVLDYSGIPFAVVFSGLLHTRDEIGAGCEECLDNTKYRVFFGQQMIVSCTELRLLQEKKFQVSTEQLRALSNCMLAGEKEKSQQIVEEMVDSVRGYSFSSIKLLVMKIATAVQELHQDDPLWYEDEQMNCWLELIRRLPQLCSLGEVKQEIGWLLDIDILSRPVREKFGEERRFSRILARIRQLTEENYADMNFNPDLVAEQLQISPAYCKKIFRANMGISLSDYITHYRLEKAAQMLLETDISVVSIGERCGFANINYFYTIFKKNYGVTAGTYRQIHAK